MIPSCRRPRHGLVSIAMLIGLLILGMVAASLLKVASGRRALVRSVENERQAVALADSGLDRALARFEAHPDYTGEVWEIPAADLGGRGKGRVTIEVKPAPDQPDQRQVSVVADYLIVVPGPVRKSHRVIVSNSPVPR